MERKKKIKEIERKKAARVQKAKEREEARAERQAPKVAKQKAQGDALKTVKIGLKFADGKGTMRSNVMSPKRTVSNRPLLLLSAETEDAFTQWFTKLTQARNRAVVRRVVNRFRSQTLTVAFDRWLDLIFDKRRKEAEEAARKAAEEKAKQEALMAQAKDGLPSGWSIAVSRTTGNIYYINDVTNESQFERPTESALPPALPTIDAPPLPTTAAPTSTNLPPGWTAQTSRSTGETYYVNSLTGQSQFEYPQPAASTSSVSREEFDQQSEQIKQLTMLCTSLQQQSSFAALSARISKIEATMIVADFARNSKGQKVDITKGQTAKEIISTMFDLVDTDASSKLDKDEAKLFLNSTGCAADQLEYYLADLMRTADADGDGLISRDEFLKYVLQDDDLTPSGHFEDKSREKMLYDQMKSLAALDSTARARLQEVTSAAAAASNDVRDARKQIEIQSVRLGKLEQQLAEIETGKVSAVPSLDESFMGGTAVQIIGKMFDVLDVDNSGSLEESEGKLFLSSTGCVPDQLDYYWTDLLRTADTDGDGTITKNEFTSYILTDEFLTTDGYFSDKRREQDLIEQIKSLAVMNPTAQKKLLQATTSAGHAASAASRAQQRIDELESSLSSKTDRIEASVIKCMEQIDALCSNDSQTHPPALALQRADNATFGNTANEVVGSMFDVLDTDDSGNLEEAECKLFLSSTGCVQDQLDYYWKDLLRTADTDCDGSISKDEFVRYILQDEVVKKDGTFRDPQRHKMLCNQIKELARMDKSAQRRLLDLQQATGNAANVADAAVKLVEQQQVRLNKMENQIKEMLVGNAAPSPRTSPQMGDMVQSAFKGGTAKEIVGKMFDILDSDSSGSLDEPEAKLFLKATGCIDSQLDYYWKDLLRAADTDRDGTIDRSEFIKYVLMDEVVDRKGYFKSKSREKDLIKQVIELAKLDPATQRHMRDVITASGKASSAALTANTLKAQIAAMEATYSAKIKAMSDSLAKCMSQLDTLSKTSAASVDDVIRGTAREIIGKMFDLLDADNSGGLDEQEAKLFLASTGCIPDQLEYYWQDLLRTADTDGDGTITKQEFTDYVLTDEFLTKDGHFADPKREQDLCEQMKTLAKMDKGAQKKLLDLTSAAASAHTLVATAAKDIARLNNRFEAVEARLQRQNNSIVKLREELNKGSLVSADVEQALKGTAKQMVSTMFDVVDTDGSGQLDEEETKLFFSATGCAADQLDYYWKDLLRTSDKDGDGLISKSEFLSYALVDEQIDSTGHFIDAEREQELREQIKILAAMDRGAFKKLQQASEVAAAAARVAEEAERANYSQQQKLVSMQAELEQSIKDMHKTMESSIQEATTSMKQRVLAQATFLAEKRAKATESKMAEISSGSSGFNKEEYEKWMKEQASEIVKLQSQLADGLKQVKKASMKANDTLAEVETRQESQAEQHEEKFQSEFKQIRDEQQALKARIAALKSNAVEIVAESCAALEAKLSNQVCSEGNSSGKNLAEVIAAQAELKALIATNKEHVISVCASTCARLDNKLSEAQSQKLKEVQEQLDAIRKVSMGFDDALATAEARTESQLENALEQCKEAAALGPKLEAGLKEVRKVTITVDDALATAEARLESHVESALEQCKQTASGLEALAVSVRDLRSTNPNAVVETTNAVVEITYAATSESEQKTTTSSDIKALCDSGEVTGETMVWSEGMEEWEKWETAKSRFV